jgi:hypothetical protein
MDDLTLRMTLQAAAVNGRHWLDLRYGWCVELDDQLQVTPAGAAALRAITPTSQCGERVVPSAEAFETIGGDAGAGTPDLDRLYHTPRSSIRPCLVRIGPPSAREWARWARIGQVANPISPEKRIALRQVLGYDTSPPPPRPPHTVADANRWYLLGGWLRATAALEDNDTRAAMLGTPAHRVVQVAREANLLR